MTQSMDEALWIEFLKQYQRKYRYIAEIQRITKELGDALSRNDRVAAELLLVMRKDEMTGADQCDKNIALLQESLQGEQRQLVAACLQGHKELLPGEDQGRQWLDKIYDLQGKIKSILQDTIQRDRVMNRKVAGENSFYAGQAGKVPRT